MYNELKNNLDKQAKLITELERSVWLRKEFDLPNTGVVAHQLVTNGYGDFKEVRIKHEGEVIRVVKCSEGLPHWLTYPGVKI